MSRKRDARHSRRDFLKTAAGVSAGTMLIRDPLWAQGAPARFVLLHRPRTWSATERRWIGWERKRGKLEMLLRHLAQRSAPGFLPVGADMRLAEGTRYVVTLDSDTTLPAGSLRELVSIAAHPLNTPHIDRKTRRVTAGCPKAPS